MGLSKEGGGLNRYYGKKVIILLDEYDTPLQEAYVGGYWEQMVQFIRSMFNATFKTNPYLNRAFLMTMEDLMNGRTLTTEIDEEIVFNQLYRNRDAIWIRHYGFVFEGKKVLIG